MSWNTSVVPEHGKEFDYDPAELGENIDVRVIVVYGEKRIQPLFVIVETWDRRQYGRGKREYEKLFTKEERTLISRWHTKLYGYYLRTGIPQKGVSMKPSTYDLLVRAANFFATI